jgi:hypothetical protein
VLQRHGLNIGTETKQSTKTMLDAVEKLLGIML